MKLARWLAIYLSVAVGLIVGCQLASLLMGVLSRGRMDKTEIHWWGVGNRRRARYPGFTHITCVCEGVVADVRDIGEAAPRGLFRSYRTRDWYAMQECATSTEDRVLLSYFSPADLFVREPVRRRGLIFDAKLPHGLHGSLKCCRLGRACNVSPSAQLIRNVACNWVLEIFISTSPTEGILIGQVL